MQTDFKITAPVLDMNVIQKAAQDAAMKAALEEVKDYYLGYNSPYRKQLKEYMQSCARGYTFISNMPNKMDLDFVCVEDVDKALEFVGRDQWDSLYIKCPSEEEYDNGQNTERNQ